jgi:glycosyltransferase involved in cell wall biosynthesis
MGLFTFLINKKTAINVDGLEWLRPKWKGLGAKYFRFASYLSTKFFNVVITDSERMADIYKSEFNCPSITIAYGANIGYSSKPELINKLRLTANDYYLVVGRLVPDNNADLIVRGFVRSDSKRKLVILGDVPYKDKYAESVRSTTDERVLFPGYVRDQNLLRELYCNSYVYIHGHEFGGTNPALLKALGYGCCVLALDTQFNREVLEGEKYGVYFSKNEESIVKMLGQVDLNESIVIQKKNIARERITSNYTWGKITSQYEELFRSMVDSSN